MPGWPKYFRLPESMLTRLLLFFRHHTAWDLGLGYSLSPKVGNPIASSLKSNVWGIPALIGLNPVSNFLGSTIRFCVFALKGLRGLGGRAAQVRRRLRNKQAVQR